MLWVVSVVAESGALWVESVLAFAVVSALELAVVSATEDESFAVVSAETGSTVFTFSGELSLQEHMKKLAKVKATNADAILTVKFLPVFIAGQLLC
jgi:hypothetical protein